VNFAVPKLEYGRIVSYVADTLKSRDEKRLARDIFTAAHFEVAVIAALIGYVLVEFLRNKLQ
jgi:hypothetical protein